MTKKKTTLLLLVLTCVFGVLAVYFALRARDAVFENEALCKIIQEQRNSNQDRFLLNARVKKAEVAAAGTLAENKRLASELTTQKNEVKASAVNAEKTKLFLDELKKENSKLKKEASAATLLSATLEKKLLEEQKRADSLNGELVEMRNTAERKDYEERITALKKTIAEGEEKIKTLENELAVEKESVAQRDAQIEELKNSKIKQLEAALIEERERVAKLQAANTSLRRKAR